MDLEDANIGHRIREIRTWRGMSIQATAELAGKTHAYLSMIERGLRPVTKRSTLEAFAHALRVSPGELLGHPHPMSDQETSQAHAALAGIETALEIHELGADPDNVAPRPWPELAEAVRESEALRNDADYATQGAELPDLLAELHATYMRDPQHRNQALQALICVYRSAAWICKNLSARGLPALAIRDAQDCAEALDHPEWSGYVAYLRGIMGGSNSRAHQYNLATCAADQLAANLADPNTVQVAGTLHLLAALASAAQSNADRAQDHLDEADRLAARLPTGTQDFGGLHFGHANVGLWRVTLGTELGQGAKVAEYARNVRPEDVPVRGWQACYWADLGRSLVTERTTQEQGLKAICRAEQLAPQWLRNNAYVRDTVTTMLSKARREAGGRELRGLAHRMGVAPTG